MFKNSDIQYYLESRGDSFNINTIRKTASKLFNDGQINSKKIGKTNCYFIGKPVDTNEVNITKCTNGSLKNEVDHLADHMVDHLGNTDSSKDIGSSDPLIRKNSKFSEKKLKKNEKSLDHLDHLTEKLDSEPDTQVIHQVIHPDQSDHLDHLPDHKDRDTQPAEIQEGDLVFSSDNNSIIGLILEIHHLTNTYKVEWELSKNERTGATVSDVQICQRDQFKLIAELELEEM
jgi:hypothetical protein